MELIHARCPACGHRYQTYARLEGDTIPCQKCGEIITVERDWRAAFIPPSPPPAAQSARTIWGTLKEKARLVLLLLLLVAALVFLFNGSRVALVSFDNGLAAPVQLFIDGKRRSILSAGEVWDYRLSSGYHGIEIREIEGGFVERRTILCEEGYYIYNIGNAHEYEIQYCMYASPEARQKPQFAPAPHRLKKAPFFHVDADILLGKKPPSEIELPEGNDLVTLTAVAAAKNASTK